MATAARVVGAIALAVVGASAPFMGLAAAEEYEGRKVIGVLEGDWFFLFGFVAAGACVWAAVSLLRRS